MLIHYQLPDMTPEEFEEWSKYIDKRMLTLGDTALHYCQAAEMFLNHFRRGINLNNSPKSDKNT